MTKEQKSTVAKQVGMAVLISAVTGALGTIIYIGWVIYIAVTFQLPTQLNDVAKVVDLNHTELINFKEEQAQKHIELNGRDDIAIDKFAIVTGWFMTIDKKLNTAINFQEMLRKSYKDNTQSVDSNFNILTVKN